MTTYGLTSEGYARKPLSVQLAEIEAAMITEFGPGIIQTSQSPLGQLNGLMADLASEIDERLLDLYQSYDPDQAEGTRLDTLARVRHLSRNGLSDADFRTLITNTGAARVDLADIYSAVQSVAGVTFVSVYSNDTAEVDDNGMEPGTIVVACLGGDDEEIAYQVRTFVPPGSILYGNTYVSTTRDGYCRTIPILRLITVDATLTVKVRTRLTAKGCPAPDATAIADQLLSDWASSNVNGKDLSTYNVRQLVESAWANVEVISIQATRDNLTSSLATIGFIEISNLTSVTINAIDGSQGTSYS